MDANIKITEKSELSEKDVKVSFSKMFQQAIMNIFETNGKLKAPEGKRSQQTNRKYNNEI